MLSPSAQLTIIYIILFKNETRNDADNDYIITKDLKSVYLSSILDESLSNVKAGMNGFGVTDYDIINDELDILHSKEMEEICIQPGPREQNQSTNSLADRSMKYNPQYKLIKVPCTKALLNRIITLSDDLEELPSDTDIIEILQYPILYTSNNILLYKFVQRYLKNFDFCEESNFNLPAMYNKIESCTAYGFIDKKGNAAVTTSEGMKFFVAVHNDVVEGKIMPPINYFACDVQYIRDNMNFMCKRICYGQNRRILPTIDIDFHSHICELLLKESKDTRSKTLVTPKKIDIPSLLPDNFFGNVVVQKVFIWFCNAEIELDKFSLPVEEIVLHCHDSTIKIEGNMPDNLTELYAQESCVEGTMELHSKFKTLVLKDVKIKSKSEVFINQECLVIELINVVDGGICVPFLEKYKEKFTFTDSYEFILQKNNDESMEHLYISNFILNENWDINEKINKLELRNIISPINAIIVINEDCESLSLTKCKCRFSFLRIKLINKLRLQSRMTVERFVLNKEKKPSISKPTEYHYHINEKGSYDRIQEIHIKNTEPRGNDSITIPKGCSKVVLHNWLGTVDLANLEFGKLIIGMETCTFNYEYKDTERLHFLSIEGGGIDWNSFTTNKRYKLRLKEVIIAKNSILNIDNNCVFFTAISCRGHIKVTEILESERKSIRLDGENNFFHLKKLQNQKYFLRISNMPLEDKLVFNDKIESCMLFEIKFKKNAEMWFKPDIVQFTIYNCRISVDKAVLEDNSETIKLRASDTDTTKPDMKIFHIYRHYIKKDQLCGNIAVLNLKKRLGSPSSELQINSEPTNIYIADYLGKIFFSRLFGPPTACLNFKNDGVFRLSKYRFVNEYIMLLKNCEIENWKSIKYDIKHLILQKVTATRGMDGGQNDNSKWMDTFKNQDLQSLVLIDMEGFDYRRFTGLNYLQLENMTIEQNISFGEPTQILKLQNVTADNSTVTINSSIEELHIQNCSGLFKINQLFNIFSKKEDDNWIIQYKNQSNDKGMYLYLEGIEFEHNFNVPQCVKTLHLKRVRMLDNQILRIDQSCENIESEEFQGIIDTSEAKSIKSVIFHFKLPKFTENEWKYSDGVEKAWYFKNDKEIVQLPNYLRTINLMNIEQGKSLELIIGEQCEELSLISCSCNFDLSKIKSLRKLTFYPTLYSDINIKLSHTIYVDELDIAYNGSGKYFRRFLVKCSSLKRLTIHAWQSDHQEFENEKIRDICMYGCMNRGKGRIENAYNKLVPHCDQDGGYSKQELLNTIMNILIKPIFYCRMRNMLKSIRLFEFQLDVKNAELLKSFIPLTKISIDYRMLDAVLLSNMPSNVRKFEIASDIGVVMDNMKNRAICKHKIKTLLSEQKEIEELTISLHFFREWVSLSFLPPNLKHLKITCFVVYSYNFVPVYEKLNLKKLTIHHYRSMSQIIERSEVMEKIYLQKIYDFLSQLIEMENLDELVVENSEGVIYYYTPSKYRKRFN